MCYSNRFPPSGQAMVLRGLALCCSLVVGFGVASAQEQTPPLRVSVAIDTGGVRTSATDRWTTFNAIFTNTTDQDRQGRVLVFYANRRDIQYGRKVWVPAHSTLSTWLLVGPTSTPTTPTSCDIEFLLYEIEGDQERLIAPPLERVRSRGVLYRRGQPYTGIYLDRVGPTPPAFGQYPWPEFTLGEPVNFTRLFRNANGLSAAVRLIPTRSLPPVTEAFSGIDHFVLASNRIAEDRAGLEALRRWVQQGGKVWVMLDRVGEDVVAALLGDALDFEVVDRVSLTTTRIENVYARFPDAQNYLLHHERPVDFVRVLLPSQEEARYQLDGWPVWFSRKVGRGKVVFTTLGPRGWYRPRTATDPRSSYRRFPYLPVALPPIDPFAFDLASPPESEERTEQSLSLLHPSGGSDKKKANPDKKRVEAAFVEQLQQMLTEEIGYSVISRRTVFLIFAGFLLASVALGLLLRKSSRPELLGWLGPLGAIGATLTFLALGVSSRQAVGPTGAVLQIVDAVADTPEVPVRGMLATFQPESGTVDLGVEHGGMVDLDLSQIQGRTARMIQTDMDAWHWENLGFPAGIRFARIQHTVPTKEPLKAIAQFGPKGIAGRLTTGPFQDPADAILYLPHGRNLAVQLGAGEESPPGNQSPPKERTPSGFTFRVGPRDVLPQGQFLASAVLSDRQQKRQQLYRQLLPPPTRRDRKRNDPLLLVWTKPVAMPFLLPPGTRTSGNALLRIPLELQRSPPGTEVVIPGPFTLCQRILADGLVPLPRESNLGSNLHFRFSLPSAVLPLQIEQARLTARFHAPGRRITVSGVPAPRAPASLGPGKYPEDHGQDGRALVALHQVESPLDPIEVTITDKQLLRLDAHGGLHVHFAVSKLLDTPNKGTPQPRGDIVWKLDYVEMEVSGRTAPQKMTR
jgi:hypothetical protein